MNVFTCTSKKLSSRVRGYYSFTKNREEIIFFDFSGSQGRNRNDIYFTFFQSVFYSCVLRVLRPIYYTVYVLGRILKCIINVW